MRIRGRIARVVARVVAIVVARVGVGMVAIIVIEAGMLAPLPGDLVEMDIIKYITLAPPPWLEFGFRTVVEEAATLTPALVPAVARPAPPTTIVLVMERQIAVETETLENTNVMDNVQPLARHKDQDGTVFVNHNQINVVKKTLEEKQNVLDQG